MRLPFLPERPPLFPAPVTPAGGAPEAPPAGDPAPGARDVFVARQPIFDGEDGLTAYEILYRSGAQQNWADGTSTDQMCTDTVIHTLLSIGLAPLTGGTLAFVNHSRDFLVRGLYELFDPATVVIELLETVAPDDEVVAACERLVAAGYTLALDDFVNAPGYERMLEIASIIKIDVLNRPVEELEQVVAELAPYGVRLLAERVETAEVRDACRALGFTLFQGYYFSRPQIVSRRELNVEQSSMLRLLNLLNDPTAGEVQIEEAFRSDPALSFKLLRIANSAAFGGREVQSIGFALRMVGRKVLHRWLTLLLVSSMASQSGVSQELVTDALTRARMCELLGEHTGRAAQVGPLFLLGLCSRLDALLRIPTAEVVTRMALAADVRQALLTREGPLALPLVLVERYSQGEWAAAEAAADTLGLPMGELAALYTESLKWAGERLRSAE
jgi:EAL and modified HD-GYP domain-containing signal transduction protein